MKITVQSNYLAKVVELGEPRNHPKADRLQIFTVDFENIITDFSYKQGDIVVVFPIECQINESLLSWTNGFRDPEKNREDTKGFFENHRRVRAISLRGEKAGGFCISWDVFKAWTGLLLEPVVGQEFDSIGDTIVCNKYEPPKKGTSQIRGKKSVKGFSRLVDGQFTLHEDTKNLRRNMDAFELNDQIVITYKLHGTNAAFANILTKTRLPWWKRLIGWPNKVYGPVYSSRKVVRNQYETSKVSKFYETDIWGEMSKEVLPKIPQGFTVYGEIVGYGSDGEWIQKGYDYGCQPGEKKFYLFRVSFTNPEGHPYELSWTQIEEFAEKYGFDLPKCYYQGTVLEWLNYPKPTFNLWSDEIWAEKMVKRLEHKYNEKDCFMCSTPVPEEGIVVRKENLFTFEAYKLKSFRFLKRETEELDKV